MPALAALESNAHSRPAVPHVPVSRPTAKTVAHGSLIVPAAANRDFEAASAYLGRDSRMADVISRAEHAPHELYLKIVHDGNDRFDPTLNTVFWDPRSALRTTGGGTQSPALGLGHELDHATVDPAIRMRGAFAYDAAYDNGEEKRVITGSEAHAARTLGEAVRHDHGGAAFIVASATATERAST